MYDVRPRLVIPANPGRNGDSVEGRNPRRIRTQGKLDVKLHKQGPHSENLDGMNLERVL